MNKASKSLAAVLGFALIGILTFSAAGTRNSHTVSAAMEFIYAIQDTSQQVSTLDLKPGESVDLWFKGAPNFRNYKFGWVSSNSDVATVDQKGVIKAVADGSAEIRFVIGDGSVYISEPVFVTVSSMTLTAGTPDNRNMSMAELKTGGSIDLNFYGITDWKTRKSQYISEWESSDETVAAVNQTNGVVTGVSKGTAVIVFRIYDMEKDILLTSAPVTITVK